MIDSCILSQHFFGGQYEQGGEVYTISNSAYPRNQDPLAPPKVSTAAPSSHSTSQSAPHSTSAPEAQPNPAGTNVVRSRPLCLDMKQHVLMWARSISPTALAAHLLMDLRGVPKMQATLPMSIKAFTVSPCPDSYKSQV
jgi:hypothetical protein